ncbi:MAG: hypothetical protein ACOYB8_11810 [Eubacteriaceae bacterium]
MNDFNRAEPSAQASEDRNTLENQETKAETDNSSDQKNNQSQAGTGDQDEAFNSMYSGDFQIALFGIDPKTVMEPVLDVSCGPDPQLVLSLRMAGLDAYGADIDAPDYPFTHKASWTSSNFGQNQWGTILSNIGVPEIINAAISDKSEALQGLTLAYYNLLGCLKTGGKFIYAPSIPGLEETIPSELFSVSHEEITPGLERTVITRLKDF